MVKKTNIYIYLPKIIFHSILVKVADLYTSRPQVGSDADIVPRPWIEQRALWVYFGVELQTADVNRSFSGGYGPSY